MQGLQTRIKAFLQKLIKSAFFKSLFNLFFQRKQQWKTFQQNIFFGNRCKLGFSVLKLVCVFTSLYVLLTLESWLKYFFEGSQL